MLDSVDARCNHEDHEVCHVMFCGSVMLCYVMLCYVMLCYVMLCYVMLCYVMLNCVTGTIHVTEVRMLASPVLDSGLSKYSGL